MNAADEGTAGIPPAGDGPPQKVNALISLREPGMKRYFAGLVASMSGTWIQTIALAWLVVHVLEGQGRESSQINVVQFLPMLVLGAWSGSLADRLDKRAMLFVTQIVLGLCAIALAILDFTGRATFSVVLFITALTGLATAFDTPARRAIIGDLVPKPMLSNAMALNTGVMTSSRVIGMAIGGFVTRYFGTGWCFLINGVSYLAMLLALIGLGTREYKTVAPAKGGVRDAFRHIVGTRILAVSMMATAAVATFAFNFQLTFPLLIDKVYRHDADALGLWFALSGVGSVAGAMLSARRPEPTFRLFMIGAVVMSLFTVLVALAPWYLLSAAAIIPLGVGGGLMLSQLSGLLIMCSPTAMRGRVLAFQTVVFLGSTPVGSPIIGALSDLWDPRWGMAAGGIVALAGTLAAIVFAHTRDQAVTELTAL